MAEDGDASLGAVTSGGVRYAMPYECYSFHSVRPEEEGRPLVDVLAERLGHPVEGSNLARSRNLWRQALQAGRVARRTLRDYEAPFEAAAAGDLALRGDDLRVLRHVHEGPVPIEGEPRCLYEDADLLVLEKPAGLVMSSPGLGVNSLEGFARQYHAKAQPCHRLDAQVSGLVVFAKNGRMRKILVDAFAARRVQKRYIARVSGAVPLGTDVVVAGRLDFLDGGAVVADSGKPSETRVRLLDAVPAGRAGGGAEALVECLPVTGRRHQIRAHLRHLGWPIANDFAYGGGSREPVTLYRDGPQGGLAKAFRGCRLTWCPECDRVASMLRGDAPRPVSYGGAIWLHAQSYTLPDLGLRFRSPLPPWAEGLAGPLPEAV